MPPFAQYRAIPVADESCVPGVFVRGGAVPRCGDVVRTVGQGKQAALNIDAYLPGGPLMKQEALQMVIYENLNIDTIVHGAQIVSTIAPEGTCKNLPRSSSELQ